MALMDTLRVLHEFTKEYSLGGWFGDSDPGNTKVVTTVTELLSFLDGEDLDTIPDGMANNLIEELVAFMRSRFTFQTDSTTHQLIEPVQPRDLSQGYFSFLTQALPEEDGTIASHTLMEVLIAEGCDDDLKAALKASFTTATLNAMLETCVVVSDEGEGVEFDRERRDHLIAFLLLFFSRDELQATLFNTGFGEIFQGNVTVNTIGDQARSVAILGDRPPYQLASNEPAGEGLAAEERCWGFQHLEPLLSLVPDKGVMSEGHSREDLRLTVLSRLKVIITDYAWGPFSSPRADSRATRAVACVIESGDLYPLNTTLARFDDLPETARLSYHNIARRYVDNLNQMSVLDARLVGYVELIHFYACRLFLADVDEVSKLYDLLNKDSFALQYLYLCVGKKNPAVIEKLRDNLLAELQDGSDELVFNRMLAHCGNQTKLAFWLFVKRLFAFNPDRVCAFLYRDEVNVRPEDVVGIMRGPMGFGAADVSRAASVFTGALSCSSSVSLDAEASGFDSRDPSSKLLSNEDFLAEVIQLSDLLARIEEDIAEQQHRKAPPGTPKPVTPHASTPIFDALLTHLTADADASSEFSDSGEGRDPFSQKAKRQVRFNLPPGSPAKLRAIQNTAGNLKAKLAVGEGAASTSVLAASSVMSPPRVDFDEADKVMGEMIQEARALAEMFGVTPEGGRKLSFDT